MKFFVFFDNYSGGSRRMDTTSIFIQARCEQHAIRIFKQTFRLDPQNETCPCCGKDYSILETSEPLTDIIGDPIDESESHILVLRYLQPTHQQLEDALFQDNQ